MKISKGLAHSHVLHENANNVCNVSIAGLFSHSGTVQTKIIKRKNIPVNSRLKMERTLITLRIC